MSKSPKYVSAFVIRVSENAVHRAARAALADGYPRQHAAANAGSVAHHGQLVREAIQRGHVRISSENSLYLSSPMALVRIERQFDDLRSIRPEECSGENGCFL